jgi:cell division protein FtsX
MLLTLVPIWQLIIIPGIIAGIINKSLKHGVLSGFLGVTLSWGLYILVGMITRNVYFMLDQLGGLIFGEGFGWTFVVLILLIAAILGAFGGGIGNGLMILIYMYLEKHPSRDSKTE